MTKEHKYEDGAFLQPYKREYCLQGEPQPKPRGPRAPVSIHTPSVELGVSPTNIWANIEYK